MVRRDDAATYERWLRERTQNLTRYRIEMVGDRKLDEAIYDIVEGSPGIGIEAIRERLARRPEFVTTVERGGKPVRMLIVDARCAGGLATHLAELVKHRTLDRTPTIEQARRGVVAELGGPVWEVPPSVFKYRVPEIVTPSGDQRSAGNATRLAVLAAFWGYMAKSGENVPGGSEPLLRVNIWLQLLKRARERAVTHQAITRASKTPTTELYERLLAVTFYSSHGDDKAMEMAKLAMSGGAVPPGSSRARFDNLRDRLMLLIMLQAGGPRADELGKMRRGDLVGGVLRIHGKRGKDREVPVPQAALDAQKQLDVKLEKMLAHQQKYVRKLRAEDLLSPTAPLIPAIRYWGRNVDFAVRERGLSRQGISQRLRSLAIVAGIDPDGEDMKRIHPHGVRRLYAKTELAAGTPLNVIQANMGHASGAMTLKYAEEVEPSALRGKAFQPSPQAPAAAVEAPLVAVAALGPAATPPPPTPAEPEAPAMMEPVEPAVVRVIKQERRPPAEAEPRALSMSTEMSPAERWQRTLRRPLTAEETAALDACPGDMGQPERMACEIYSVDWGERDEHRRKRITEPRAEIAALEAAKAAERRSKQSQVLERFFETQRLEQTYCGVDSGLVWWAGNDGKLDPPMPVPSPRQVGECSDDGEDELCKSLTALWYRWMDDPGTVGTGPLAVRGPTAAGALVSWVAEMLDEVAQVEEAIVRRGGAWVAHSDPWATTASGGTQRGRPARKVFREHDRARITEWFESMAWQYRMTTGERRTSLAITSPIKVPDWYGLEDPIAALSAPDRAELLDLISLLKGDLAIRDATPRFARGLSRAQVGEVIFAMREYAQARSQLGEARVSDPSTRDLAVAQAEKMVAGTLESATGAFVQLGVDSIDMDNEFTQRKRRATIAKVKASRQEADRPKREELGPFYLLVLEKAFGPTVAADPLVSLASKIKRGEDESYPLSDYKDLLRIDWNARTIEHDEETKLEWAQQGVHSECVARRIARELWELWRSGTKKSVRAFGRPDELLKLVSAMAAYRIPCPMSQERELRGLRGEPGIALPIYEQWRKFRSVTEPGSLEAILPAALTAEQKLRLRSRQIEEMGEETAEEFQEAQERELRMAQFGYGEGEEYNSNPRARCNPYTRRAADLMPPPILVLLCAILVPRM